MVKSVDNVDITALLDAVGSGDQRAFDELFEVVYAELRRIAHGQRRRWRGDETLNTTALINEAYLKLAGSKSASYDNRVHFYASASIAMRHVLVNYSERRLAQRRGGDATKLALDDVQLISDDAVTEVLAIHHSLESLAASNQRASRVFECRVFGGMTHQETAEALGLSVATVKRDWTLASTNIYQNLQCDSVVPSAGPRPG